MRILALDSLSGDFLLHFLGKSGRRKKYEFYNELIRVPRTLIKLSLPLKTKKASLSTGFSNVAGTGLSVISCRMDTKGGLTYKSQAASRLLLFPFSIVRESQLSLPMKTEKASLSTGFSNVAGTGLEPMTFGL
jgi:hypothetical protein